MTDCQSASHQFCAAGVKCRVLSTVLFAFLASQLRCACFQVTRCFFFTETQSSLSGG